MAALKVVRESKRGENNTETDELAYFTVDEHNKKENALLEFVGLLSQNIIPDLKFS